MLTDKPNIMEATPDHARGNPLGRGIKWLFAFAFIMGATFIVKQLMGPTKAEAAWGQNWDDAVKQASTSGKPMLVLFTADWCPPCRQLKKEVFGDYDVNYQLHKNFVLMKVDLSDRSGPNNEIAQKYAVRGIPTMIVLDSNGNPVDRISGAGDKDQMRQWLDAAWRKAK